MEEKPTTLMARDESPGRGYPVYIERLAFVGAIVGFFFLQPFVIEEIDSPGWLSFIAGWCVLPVVLMLATELFGRVTQRVLSK